MASKRRIRRKQCDGKQRFETLVLATNRMFNLIKSGNKRGYIHVYFCTFCNGFHFGHAKHRQKHPLGA